MTGLLTWSGVEASLSDALNLELMPVTDMGLRVDEAGSLFAHNGEREFSLNKNARKDMIRYLGMTDKFVHELAAANPSLASGVATEMYKARGPEGVFAVKNGAPISFARNGYREVPVEDVLGGISDVLGEETQPNRAMLNRNYDVQIELVGSRSETVGVGDIIRSGVMVRFNPLGLTDPSVSPFGLRLVCSNGMTSRIEFGGGELPLLAYRESPVRWIVNKCKDAYEGMADAAGEWSAMAETPLHPHGSRAILQEALQRAGIRGRHADMVLERAAMESPETMYDVLNLLTWVSSHLLTTPSAVVRAQNASVEYSRAAVSGRCPACYK